MIDRTRRVPMGQLDVELVIRAWKDPQFAATLPTAVRAQIPASPAGVGVSHLAQAGHDGGPMHPMGTVAASCDTVAASCDTVAASCDTVAASCDTVASACDTVAASCDTVAATCDTVAATCDTVASSCSTVQSQCGGPR